MNLQFPSKLSLHMASTYISINIDLYILVGHLCSIVKLHAYVANNDITNGSRLTVADFFVNFLGSMF